MDPSVAATSLMALRTSGSLGNTDFPSRFDNLPGSKLWVALVVAGVRTTSVVCAAVSNEPSVEH